MAYDVLVRYRKVNKDTLIVQKRAINGWTFIPYLLSKFSLGILSLFVKRDSTTPEWIWSDWSNLSNMLYQIDVDMNFHAKKLEKLSAKRKTIEDWIKGEVKSLEKDEFVNKGYSDVFDVKPEDILPIGLDFIKPDQDWKKILNPKIFGGSRKTASGYEYDPGKQKVPGNFSTNYTLPDFQQHSVSMNAASSETGADGLIFYKEDEKKKKKGKGGNKGSGFNPKNRKIQRQFGETEEGHNERLEAISEGENVSDWEPH